MDRICNFERIKTGKEEEFRCNSPVNPTKKLMGPVVEKWQRCGTKPKGK